MITHVNAVRWSVEGSARLDTSNAPLLGLALFKTDITKKQDRTKERGTRWLLPLHRTKLKGTFQSRLSFETMPSTLDVDFEQRTIESCVCTV